MLCGPYLPLILFILMFQDGHTEAGAFVKLYCAALLACLLDLFMALAQFFVVRFAYKKFLLRLCLTFLMQSTSSHVMR